MVDAPERIWIEQDECPYFYEESELAEVSSPVTEYVRADLYAALEAQLSERAGRVKPLEWVDADEGMCTKWRAAALGGHYELVSFDKEPGFAVNFSWGRPLSYWFIQGEPNEWGPTGPKMFPTLEDAKAAAQADCNSRILSSTSTKEPQGVEPDELSGNTGELIDRMAEAIRGDTVCDDTPWATLPEDRKEGWRGDAERALEVVKEYLTTPRARAALKEGK